MQLLCARAGQRLQWGHSGEFVSWVVQIQTLLFPLLPNSNSSLPIFLFRLLHPLCTDNYCLPSFHLLKISRVSQSLYLLGNKASHLCIWPSCWDTQPSTPLTFLPDLVDELLNWSVTPDLGVFFAFYGIVHLAQFLFSQVYFTYIRKMYLYFTHIHTHTHTQ